MKPLLWLALCLSGCSFDWAEAKIPGEPEFGFQSEWIVQGEPTRTGVHWGYGCEDTGDWGCPPPSKITLVNSACRGCELSDISTDPQRPGSIDFTVVATDPQSIAVHLTVRFEDTGATQPVSTSARVDREVRLEATCYLVDAAAVSPPGPHSSVPHDLLRPCDGPRSAGDAIVIFPVVDTEEQRRFPFCPGDVPCFDYNTGAQLRPLSTLSITPAPISWGQTDVYPGTFAVLPPLTDGQTVSLSTALVGGDIATATIEIPPAAASAGP